MIVYRKKVESALDAASGYPLEPVLKMPESIAGSLLLEHRKAYHLQGKSPCLLMLLVRCACMAVKSALEASHLVRHGGGPHFPGDGALPEVAQADVGPKVPVKVQQDVVVARDCVEELCYVVMRLDLQRRSSLSPDKNVKVC